jgi:hypothetical protein
LAGKFHFGVASLKQLHVWRMSHSELLCPLSTGLFYTHSTHWRGLEPTIFRQGCHDQIAARIFFSLLWKSLKVRVRMGYSGISQILDINCGQCQITFLNWTFLGPSYSAISFLCGVWSLYIFYNPYNSSST